MDFNEDERNHPFLDDENEDLAARQPAPELPISDGELLQPTRAEPMRPVFKQPCDGSSGEGALCGAGGCASPEPVLSLTMEGLLSQGGRYAGNGEGYATVTVPGAGSRTGVEVGLVERWHTA